MFNALNLADFHCEDLCITTHLILSRALAERIIESSHGHKRRNIPDYALYGCIYKLDEVPHAVRAHIRHVERNEYHVEFRYMAEKWPRPPKDINSPKILASLLAKEPQETAIQCEASFIYKKDSGWNSEVDLPIPLSRRKNQKEIFSHIESVRLSKRVKGQLQYFMQIEQTEEDITHRVYLSEIWKGALSEDVPAQLLEHSSKLSRSFMNKEGKE